MTVPEVQFADVLDATADELRAKLKKLRAGHRHLGQRGSAAEGAVRDMLREFLPQSLGVTVGEVADAHGHVSGQSDIIIYNAMRTPMLFASAEGGSHTVPVEGVVGVIEVKSRLQKKDLKQIVDHAQKLRALDKSAYFPTAISHTYNAYGRDWTYCPTFYSVFAYESDGTYTQELNEMQEDVEPHQRVDNLLCLDRGLILNVSMGDIFSANPANFHPTAVPGSKLAFTTQEDALVPWLALNCTQYAQADSPPINIGVYVKDRLKLSARTTHADSIEFGDNARRQIGEKAGLSPGLAAKLGTPEQTNLSPEEALELIEAYGSGADLKPTDGRVRATWDLILTLPKEQRLAVVTQALSTPATGGNG